MPHPSFPERGGPFSSPQRRGDRRRWRKGLWAETAAVWMLRLKGWRILARRVRTPVGEVDIIARRRRTLIFVEVKYRPRHDEGMAAVRAHQQARIVRAARWWLARHADLNTLTCRFDIIAVNRFLWPVHVMDAFSEDVAGTGM